MNFTAKSNYAQINVYDHYICDFRQFLAHVVIYFLHKLAVFCANSTILRHFFGICKCF
jgi:hypothetical protein